MPVAVVCPSCQHPVRLNEEMLGKTVVCLNCGRKYPAHRPGTEPPPAAEETPVPAKPAARPERAKGPAPITAGPPKPAAPPLSPAATTYARMIEERLSGAGYAIQHNVRADDEGFREYLGWGKQHCRYSDAELGGNYLCVAKRFKYSPITIFGFTESVVMVASVPAADGELVLRFDQRAHVTAHHRRTKYTNGVFPVVFMHVIPVLIAEEVDPSVAEYFASRKPHLDPLAKHLSYPVVYNAATQHVEYHQKAGLWGHMQFSAVKKLVQQTLRADS